MWRGLQWKIHANENKTLENKKAKDLLKNASRNTPKKKFFFVKTDNIPPSHAKELSRYLKIEEHHLRRMDISKKLFKSKETDLNTENFTFIQQMETKLKEYITLESWFLWYLWFRSIFL